MKATVIRKTGDVAAWHAMPVNEVVARRTTNIAKGLDTGGASSRLEKYGANRLPEGKKHGPLVRFLS